MARRVVSSLAWELGLRRGKVKGRMDSGFRDGIGGMARGRDGRLSRYVE